LAIRGPIASPELFVNARGEPFSRWGVAYILRRHTETAHRKCPTLHGKQVSPHVFRKASAYYTTFQSLFILKIIGAGQAQLAAVYGRYGLLAPGVAPQGG